MLHSLIFWAGWLFFPALTLGLWLLARPVPRGLKVTTLIALLGLSVLAYARFVEPRILTVTHAHIDLSDGADKTQTVRIALVGDPHYGVFPNAMPMDRIIARAEAEGAEALFLAGDLTYHPDPEKIADHLAPLANTALPVFAVMGNHDVGFPGPDLTAPIFAVLQRHGVNNVENRALEVRIGESDLVVAGASDIWQRQYSFDFSASLPGDRAVLLLVHNPDTASLVPAALDYDLMLAGHTHGGQIRLPVVYKWAIPTRYPFDIGMHTYASDSGDRRVYVTPGTGMVGLPMRFLMPPRIDMLTLTVPAVEKD